MPWLIPEDRRRTLAGPGGSGKEVEPFMEGQRRDRAVRAVGELVGIQYLRGIAAMMVLLFHLQVQLHRLGYEGAWPSSLIGGIDIFYVISGFIMWSTTVARGEEGPLPFWRRRIARIVPLYWTVTGFVVIVMLIAPRVMQSSRFDLDHVVASFLFVGYPHPITGRIEPVVIPGWTLTHEMFFYLLFGLFLLARPRIRLIGILAVLAGLVAVGRLFALPPTTIAGFYTSDMLLEFGLGVALGALASHGPGLTGVSRMWSWVMLGTGAVALASLPLVAELSGFVMRGIPAGLIVAGLLVIEAHSGLFRSRLLHGLGDASYSIYLSHMISLAASSQLWRVMALPQDAGGLCLYMVFAVLLSLAGGWLLHLLVERPFNRRLRGATPKRAQIIRTQGDA